MSRKPKHPESLVVNLMGGLGNQLFCYSFGRFLSNFYGIQVSFETHPWRVAANHGLSLAGRSLRGEFVSNGTKQPHRFFARVSLELQERYPCVRPWLPTLTGAQYCPEGEFPSLRVGTGGVLQGYFQTFRFASYLIESELTWESLLPNKGPSQWLTRAIEEAQSEEIVALHLRRGDYTAHPAWGLLDKRYYEAALHRLPDRLSSAPVWVFSDDPDRAEQELSGLRGNMLIVRTPKEVDAAESLVLMSRASAVVTANSTFSWWAGALAEPGTPVTAPNPWFPAQHRYDFYFPHWVKLESVFQ